MAWSKAAIEPCEKHWRRPNSLTDNVLAKIIGWYNGQRLHRALGYLRPVDYYRAQPDERNWPRPDTAGANET